VRPDAREALALLSVVAAPKPPFHTGTPSGEPALHSSRFYGPSLPDGNRFPPLQTRHTNIAGCADLVDGYLRELDVADGLGRDLELRRLAKSLLPAASEPLTTVHRKLVKSLLLNSGAVGVAEVLASVVARDEELEAWATSLPAAAVRRKIPANELVDGCRYGDACGMTPGEATRLFRSFLR
jgi:hypothetical protein